MLYNVVVVSGEQNESAICIHISLPLEPSSLAPSHSSSSSQYRAEFLVLCSSSPLPILNMVVYIFGEGNGTPLQYSCLENPMDGGAWKAVVHGVARVRHD